MVATQVLISLCVAGMAVAAPQLALPGVQRTATYTTSSSVNEGQIVNNVVTALQPSIAEAVANALRSIQTTVSYNSGANSGASSFGGAAFSNRQVSNSGSSFSSSQSATGSVGAAFNSGAAAEEEVTARPEYNYEFKVASEGEQTYISQQEARDGDQLTGTYSYVDANGALVTVNYQAGPEGFAQTTDKQEGFVDVSARPVRVASTTSAANSGSASASRFSGATSTSSNSASRFSAGATSGASRAVTATSSIDQSALIRQIVTALQPQIATSVNAALSAQQRAATAVRTSSVQTSAAPVRGGSSTSAIFGDGYNVRIATPEFNIEY